MPRRCALFRPKDALSLPGGASCHLWGAYAIQVRHFCSMGHFLSQDGAFLITGRLCRPEGRALPRRCALCRPKGTLFLPGGAFCHPVGAYAIQGRRFCSMGRLLSSRWRLVNHGAPLPPRGSLCRVGAPFSFQNRSLPYRGVLSFLWAPFIGICQVSFLSGP